MDSPIQRNCISIDQNREEQIEHQVGVNFLPSSSRVGEGVLLIFRNLSNNRRDGNAREKDADCVGKHFVSAEDEGEKSTPDHCHKEKENEVLRLSRIFVDLMPTGGTVIVFTHRKTESHLWFKRKCNLACGEGLLCMRLQGVC
jgi:hypothetical protein